MKTQNITVYKLLTDFNFPILENTGHCVKTGKDDIILVIDGIVYAPYKEEKFVATVLTNEFISMNSQLLFGRLF